MKAFCFALLAVAVAALPQEPKSPKSPKSPAAPGEAKGGKSDAWNSLLAALDFPNGNARDLTNGTGCRDVFLIGARGSGEPGTVGVTINAKVCKLLRAKYGAKMGCDGVDPKGYTAGIMDNLQPKGTTEASIAAGNKIFEYAHQKCPKSVLLFTGYSQGAALMHNVVGKLPAPIKAQIAGGTLFGDTKNQQSKASIEGLPADKLMILCAKDDGVCWGKLAPSAGHLAYMSTGDIDKAANFLIQRTDAALNRRGPAALKL